MESASFDYNLMVADAFVRGIREIGYKSAGTALDELVDNAYQAGAKSVHVIFGFEGSTPGKPGQIALIDDGHGMDPAMIRLGVIWGGTHRENDRSGFGRYGYGLGSASLSIGRRLTVVSRPDGGALSQVVLDVDDISAGKYSQDGRVVVPPATRAKLPAWLEEYVDEHFDGLPHGTIVLIEKLDKLEWKTTTKLQTLLLQHFGITYRNYLRRMNITVAGARVEPVDPLFLTPGARFYDFDDDRAQAEPPLAFDVKDSTTGKELGTVQVRFSYMSPTFANVPEDKLKERGRHNPRFPILKENHGIIVLRNGRQIDVLHRTPWTTFVNYDYYWKVEIDFPATLDEEFSITTSKQQIGLSERMWELLKQQGVYRVIETLRKRGKADRAIIKARRDEQGSDTKRASEEAMEKTAKFKTRKPAEPVERQKEVQKLLDIEIARRAKGSGVPVVQVAAALEAEAKTRPYKVEREALIGAPFYRVAQVGSQRLLYLNTTHRFFTDVYSGPESAPRLRAALEIVLFVLGEAELDATDERHLFYQGERFEWSKLLEVALDRLDQIDVAEAEEPDYSEEPSMADENGVSNVAAG